MKSVPARTIGLGLAFMLCAGAFLLWGAAPGRAAGDRLHVTSAARRTASGLVELRISWRWEDPSRKGGWGAREELLAVSFDTRTLVFESEEAPLGRGASGDRLRRLEEVAGPDGARRLFVIPEGEHGYVRIRFRPVWEEEPQPPAPFRVYVVRPHGDIWMTEVGMAPPGPGRPNSGREDF